MERNARTKKLKIAIIAIALLLCFALAVGITTAFYQAQRRAMGSVKMDQGIIIDYKGFNKGDENIWQRETTTTFKLFEERDAQPGEQIYAYPAGIRANAESVDFYARLKLEYNFYNVVGSVETPVALANPKSLITTSSTFFDSNWVPSTDGYYYYGAGTALSKFSKDGTNYIDIFAKDGEGNVVAKFLIEGANFVGETAGEGGGFVVEDTYINKIVVLLTLETLQGDADAEAEGWKITKSSDQTVDVSGETDADITIDDIISGDRDGEITIAGDPAQPLTITIGSKAFYGCTKLKLTLSNSENIIYQIASDAFSSGATIMYGLDNVTSLLVDPSTSGKSEGAANRWKVSEPNLYLFLPTGLTSTSSSYGDYQYTDDQGTWYFDLIDESGNKVSALSSKTSGGVSTLGASTLESTNNYTARINYVDNNSELTTLTIPTYIGSDVDSARYVVSIIAYRTANSSINNQSNITLINLPAQLKTIGDYSFYNCSALTSITIPDSVTSIGDWAFGGCSGLTEITIPNSVTSIEYGAFGRCSSLTSITIPDSVTSIGKFAFQYCSGLTSITVAAGNSVYHSEGNCLIDTANKKLIAGCKNSVIPTDGRVTSIGEDAFYGCSELTSITIPDSVTSIGSAAFQGCESLQTLNIPDGVTSIGMDVFWGCGSLISITIPNSVTSIGSSAFNNCGGLTSIIIPNSVTSIGMYAFDGCSSLTSITIPDSVTSIGAGTFRYCSSLTTINIGAGISETSWLPNNVSSMTVTISENNPYLATDSKAIFAKSNGGLTVSKYISSDTTYKIPSSLNGLSVIGIGGNAFYNCSRLTSITIPNSVTSIGSSAFSNCSALTTITIPDSVTSIGEWAFSLCSSLLTATIGNGVTNIGSFAFSSCSNLETIIIGNSLISIGSQAFQHCESLTSITIPDSVTTIGLEAFGQCKNLTSITIPDSVTSLGSHVFANCVSLQTATIGNGVEIIGGYSFYGCTNLQSITLGSKIKTIGDLAFYDCSNLTTVIWNVTYDLGGVNATGPSITQYNTSSTGGLSITDTLVAPTNIEEGFVFEGWSDGSTIYAAGSDYTFTTTNRNLTAVWSKYKVSFDANGGNGSIDAVVVEKGNSITLPNFDNFTRDGYAALGWAVDKSATNADYQALASYTPTQSITLYVIWVKVNNDYTTGYTNLIFDLNGGIGKITFEGIYLSQNENVTLPDISGVTKEGSIFLGWAINGDVRVRYTAGQTVTLNPNYRIIAIWHSPITVIITGNGGVGEDIVIAEEDGSSTINLDDYINSFTAPEGYCFANWETNTGRTYSKGQTFNFLDYSENVTIKAVWSKLITINFDLNGGEGTVPSPITTAYRANYTINTGNAFTKEGYKFAGWTLVDADDNVYATFGYNQSGTFNYSGENFTLKARWTEPTTVTFYNDDTKSQSFTMTGFFEADGITMPEGTELTNSGYMLVGWSTAANDSWVSYDIGSHYSNFTTIELYAVWKTESECAKIVFDLSEVEGQANIVKIGYSGDFLISSIEIFTSLRNASGQLISGWTETQGSTNVNYSMNSSIYYPWFTGQTKTLYPVWVTPVTLTFDANGGEGDVPSPIETYYQGYFDIPAVSLTKEGYVFAGWAWESTATSAYYNNGSTNNGYWQSDGRSTLYAVWTVPRTLTFDSNGGQGEVPASIQTYYEGRFDIPSVTLTKDGYTFLGWSFTKNLTSTYGGGDMFEKEQTNCGYYYNADKTLYAVWGAPVTITFDMNDGTGTSLGTATVSFGESFNFPSNPSRTGYNFLGWDYRQNAGNDYYWGKGTTSSNSRFISGSVTIYAQWEVLNNQVYVGSLTTSELAAIQELWSGKSSLSEISDTTLIQSMYNNNIHSRFGVNVYLNDVKLGLKHTDNYNYGFNYNTNYAKLSTNTYVFEFENAMPTGWKLVNYRYEVQAEGDVTIVDGKARATVNYSYIESFADPSDNLFLMFVLPSAPEESTSVGINISAAPGNVIEKMVTGDSTFEWSYFLQTGFLIEIYDGENNLLWLGNPSSSNGGMVSYRFATGTYKLRIYTTNVVGFGIYSAADASLITGQDVSSVTHGDNYSEVTFNYTFADGNPDMVLLFSMADVEVDAAKLQSLVTSFNMCGPDNVVGTWVTTLIKMMTGEDVPADELNYAGYMGMLYQDYFNGTIANIPNFSIYDSNGNEICSLSNITENTDNLYILTRGATYTIKFASEVKNVFIADGDNPATNELIPVSYNETTGTWDATVTAYDVEYMMFLVFTPDIDLSAYEDLPQYDANEDYTGYLDF